MQGVARGRGVLARRRCKTRLRLLSLATRGKQEAQREATWPQARDEPRRDAQDDREGPALPSAVQEKLRVMRARRRGARDSDRAKRRGAAPDERCLERCKGMRDHGAMPKRSRSRTRGTPGGRVGCCDWPPRTGALGWPAAAADASAATTRVRSR